jgi:hypothetical protein
LVHSNFVPESLQVASPWEIVPQRPHTASSDDTAPEQQPRIDAGSLLSVLAERDAHCRLSRFQLPG